MSLPVFLLRLVGKAPEQLAAERSFKSAMRRMDEVEGNLDTLLFEIRQIDEALQHKQKALNDVASSTPPAALEILMVANAPLEETPDEPVRIECRAASKA